MKVKTKTYVNIRKSPNRDIRETGILNPNVELEVEGTVPGENVKELVNGEEIESSIWYKDAAGHFYWGGGFRVMEEINFQDIINRNFDGTSITEVIDYNKILNLSNDVKVTKGIGVTIALMDTGISQHPNLSDSIFGNQFDFTKSQNGYGDKDGHGTFLAGLISSHSNEAKSLQGIAPKCKVVNLKVIKDNGTAVGEYLELGLNKITEMFSNCIINMSLNITVQEFDQLNNKNVFDNLSKKYACIAAAGEDERLLLKNGIYSPASSDKVIAVGSINEFFFTNNRTPKFDPRLDFIIPQFNILSISNNSNYTTLDGVSSMACAMVSAIISLVFSKNGSNNLSLESALIELNKLATPYAEIENLRTLTLIKP